MANQIVVNANQSKGTIDRNIYGHFSEHLGRCIYDGFYVGEDSPIPNIDGMRLDIIEAMKNIKIPVLRWPGGCFADEYHWKDGIGPKESRPRMINTHWGGVVEDNSFGTHEFFRLCELLECEPYICGNVGSGTVQEMSEWVEYMTFDGDSPRSALRKQNGREEPWKLKYFGVGNENWGCGGRMRAEFYADQVNRYGIYARDYGENKLFRIAAGPRNANYHWTEVLMEQAGLFIDGLALHYYTRIGDKNMTILQADGNERYVRNNNNSRGSATQFAEDAWFGIMKASAYTDTLVKNHSAIMDKYDPEKRVALIVDEWGTWFDCEPGTNPGFLYQQNTMRDAVSAAISLNIFNNHCDRVRMTNIAQTINVLQAMILTEGDKMILTPTYHVFDLYKVHQDAELLSCAMVTDQYCYGEESLDQVSATVSKDAAGMIHMTLCNIDPNNCADVTCHIADFPNMQAAEALVLTAPAMNSMNTFEEPEAVKPEAFTGYEVEGDTVKIHMPSKSVVRISLKN